MKNLSLEQMETTEGGRFWGETFRCGAANAQGNCNCDITMQMVWITVSHTPYTGSGEMCGRYTIYLE